MRGFHWGACGVAVSALGIGLERLGLLSEPVAVAFVVVGIVLLCYAFVHREKDQALGIPDVSLDFEPSSSSLVLTASGANAFDIKISSATTGDSVHGYLDAAHIPGLGKVTGAIVTEATEASFQFIPAVRIGTSQPITPLVKDRFTFAGSRELTIFDFAKRKFDQRHTDELRELVEESKHRAMPEAEYANRLKRLERPIEEKLTMTYCDKPNGREGRRCWRKIETLHYDPSRTPPILQVRHAGEPTEL
jgi:hypothetical protein